MQEMTSQDRTECTCQYGVVHWHLPFYQGRIWGENICLMAMVILEMTSQDSFDSLCFAGATAAAMCTLCPGGKYSTASGVIFYPSFHKHP